MSFKELTGKRIIDICLSEDDCSISFLIDVAASQITDFDAKLKPLWPQSVIDCVVMTYATQNDCCNTVWFSDFENLDLLIGSEILDVEEKGWNEIDSEQHEVLESAFWTIKTSRGYADIEVRNSHNGYYGGSVCFSGIFTDLKVFTAPLVTDNQRKLKIYTERGMIEANTQLGAPTLRRYKV